MKQNIFFRFTHSGSTSILETLKNAGIHDPSYGNHIIQPNGFVLARYNRGGDQFFVRQEWEGEFEENAYLWTIVRNPWARVVSCYHSMRHKGYFSKRHGFADFVNLIDTSMQINTAEEGIVFAKMTEGICDCEFPGVPGLYPDDPELADRTCGCFFAISAHCWPWRGSFLSTWPQHGESATSFPGFTPASEVFHGRFGTILYRGLDKVVRFEHLQEDFNDVCDNLEIERLELPHINGRATRGELGEVPFPLEPGPLTSDRITSNNDYTTHYTAEVADMVRRIYEYEIVKFEYKFGD